MEVVSELEYKHQSPQLRERGGASECGGGWVVRRREVGWRGERCRGGGGSRRMSVQVPGWSEDMKRCEGWRVRGGRGMRVRRCMGGWKTGSEMEGGVRGATVKGMGRAQKGDC